MGVLDISGSSAYFVHVNSDMINDFLKKFQTLYETIINVFSLRHLTDFGVILFHKYTSKHKYLFFLTQPSVLSIYQGFILVLALGVTNVF